MNDFFRFPHTPHLTWLGPGSPREDKVLSKTEIEELLSDDVVVEEKLDGANLGISLGEEGQLWAQNRGQYLQAPFTGQFSRLRSWLAMHQAPLASALSPDLILFGEWCAAKHSVSYTDLPDTFLGFDIYQRSSNRFWSIHRRNQLFSQIGITPVPELFRGKTNLSNLKRILEKESSRYLSGPMEGVIIRKEEKEWLMDRAKLVRPDFTQAITEHWSRKGIEWNRIHSK